MRSVELGKLAGDVYCFSRDNIIRLAEKLGVSEAALIGRYGGVECGLGDGNIGIDRMTAVNNDGSTHSVVVIGSEPEKLNRLLGDADPTFNDFYMFHPRHAEVGKGLDFNEEIFDTIAAEYKAKLIG